MDQDAEIKAVFNLADLMQMGVISESQASGPKSSRLGHCEWENHYGFRAPNPQLSAQPFECEMVQQVVKFGRIPNLEAYII